MNFGWKEKFVDRMRIFKDFYDNFVTFDSGFEMMPQLILVCEDDKHMPQVFKQIVANNCMPENSKIYFTTDLKQNSTSLQSSLIEFVKDETTGKYKKKDIEIKLLG